MPAPTALRCDLPLLHQDGTIKFRAVLASARARRAFRREDDRKARWTGVCLIHRFDRVRDDMSALRKRIADDRAFWSVANVPTTVVVTERVEWFGHSWDEARVVPAADAERARDEAETDAACDAVAAPALVRRAA